MKNFIRLICIIVLSLSLNSCGTYYSSTSYLDTYDELYNVNTISSPSQVSWMMQRDFRFRYNYMQFVINQPYSWYQDYYSYNFMWNYGFNNSWNFYNNSYNTWWNWNNPWNSNVYNNWYAGPWYNQGYNAVWNSSHRGSRYSKRPSLFYSNTNGSSLLIDSKVSTSVGRTYIPNTTRNGRAHASMIESTIIRNNSKPTVITRPTSNSKPIWNNSKPVIRNTNKPVINNNSSRPRINNSSSRPNLNNTNSRPSVPQTTTKSSRKRDN